MIPVHRPYFGPEELAALSDVLDSRWVSMGAATAAFEEGIRDVAGARHAIAVNTGTSAIHLALEALDLEPGDEVIVPSLTFVASVHSIVQAGGRPVFCEVLPETLAFDPEDARSRVTSRTRALLPIHFAGQACRMSDVLALAEEHDLSVVEDAAHAFGSSYRGRPVGSLGDITCFSFDPIKNITCIDGGAVVTDDDDIAARVRLTRNMGIDRETWARRDDEESWRYEVRRNGFRYHLNNFNAAVGLAQLDRLEAFRRRRLEIVRRYDEALADVGELTLLEHDLTETFPFMYVVRVPGDRRGELKAALAIDGVATGVNYIPNHLQPLFADRGVELPITDRLFREIVTLPLYYEMSDEDVETVIAAIRRFF